MIVKAFSVFDVKAAGYMPPFFMPHNGQALRAFGDMVCDQKSEASRHPEDYSLFEIGSFDDNSGELRAVAPPKFLAKALDFVQKEK